MSLLLSFRVSLAKNALCLAVMPMWHSAFALLEFRDCVTYNTVFPPTDRTCSEQMWASCRQKRVVRFT